MTACISLQNQLHTQGSVAAGSPASCCHNSCLLDVATLNPAGKSRCWPQVVNRDELLNSLEDIATAFDMRLRPYSATSGQPFPRLTPLPTAVVAQTSWHPCLSPAQCISLAPNIALAKRVSPIVPLLIHQGCFWIA